MSEEFQEAAEGGETGGEDSSLAEQVEGGEQQQQNLSPVARERFNAIYAKHKASEASLKSYSDLGSRDDVMAGMARLKAIDEAVARQRAKTSVSDSEREEEGRRETIRKQLLEVHPDLKKLDDFDRLNRRIANSNMREMKGTLNGLLTDGGYKVEATEMQDVLNLFDSRMTADQQERFQDGDTSVVAEVFDKMKESRFMKAMMDPSAGIQKQTPFKKHGFGGTGGNKSAPAKTIAEATKRAMEMMGD